MRRRTPLAFAGFVVIVLAAVIGFASFTAERSPDVAPSQATAAPLPDAISGRLTAAILSSKLSAVDPPAPVEDSSRDSIVIAPEPEPNAQAPATVAPSTTTTVATATAKQPAVPTTSTTTTTRPPAPTIPITQPPVTFGATVERWRPLVATYFPKSLLDEALSVMECESRGDPNAQNHNSSAAGLFQFLASTWNWASSNAGFSGVSVYDPEANIATAAFLVEYSLDRDLPAWQHWVCQPDIGS